MSTGNSQSSANQGRVIRLGPRFFSSFGKNGSVQTAWCVAGAAHFQIGSDADINPVLEKLAAKKKQFTIITYSI